MFHTVLYAVRQGLQLDELAQERLATMVARVFADVIPNLHQRSDDARVQIFPQIHVFPEQF